MLFFGASIRGCEGREGEGMSDYWVKKDGKNKRAYVLDANGKPRSRICDGAHFTNRADVIAHAMKFGGTPMVVIDIHGTSCPIELGSNSAHSVH
jgi:hypothetical protein